MTCLCVTKIQHARGLYCKTAFLGLALTYLAQVILCFASEYLSSKTAVQHLRFSGFMCYNSQFWF